VSRFSHVQAGVSGPPPIGLPSIGLPSSLEMSSGLMSLYASMAVPGAGGPLDCVSYSDAAGLSLPHPASVRAVANTTNANVVLLTVMPDHRNADRSG
jgi:hypothetical protein